MAIPAARWTRLEHDERRAQIHAAARRLYSEHHYAAVSSTAIAEEAGVARGLLHHYFGTKRELYLEVVRSMLRLPPPTDPEPRAGRSLDEIVDESVGRWLDTVHRNRVTWLAAVGAEGLGRDPDVERIVEEARERTVDRLVAVLGLDGAEPQRELRALLHAYGGMATAAATQWLRWRRLSRAQVHALLSSALLHVAREAWPKLQRDRAAAPRPAGRGRTR